MINLGETIKKAKFSPPSLMTATPNTIASNANDMCPTSVSNADIITVMSSCQNERVYINYSTPTNKDSTQGKTTGVRAVMMGKPKDGYHRHHSNKRYK